MGGDFIKDIIFSENFGSILGVFLTAVLTYLFTKWADRKKQFMDVYRVQLNKIFLPLYLYLHNKEVTGLNRQEYIDNLLIKRRKYYLYIPDEFHRIIDRIEKQWRSGNVSDAVLKGSKEYIDYQYYKLRKTLGYSDAGGGMLRMNSYTAYTVAKTIALVLVYLQLSLITILAIFGADFYNDWPDAYNVLTMALFVLIMLTLVVMVIYIYCEIIWLMKVKRGL